MEMLMTALLTLMLAIWASPQNLLRSDELGLDITLPAGAQMVHRPGDGGEHFLIRDGQASPAWSLRIESLATENADPAAILDRRASMTTTDRLIDRGPTLVDGRPAERLWLLREGPNGQPLALGYLVIPQILGRVAICSAVTTPDALDSIQPLIDQSFASIRLRDDPSSTGPTQAALRRGVAWLQAIDEQALRSLGGTRQVLRVHRTGPDPSEVAYGTLEAHIGPRGEVAGTQGPPEAWQSSDREQGLIVTTHLRFVMDADAEHYVDRAERSWVSLDLSEEIWADQATERKRDQRWTNTELGFRTAPGLGQPQGQLLVIRSDQRTGARDDWTYVVSDEWLPRGLRWLVPATRPLGTELIAWRTWDTSSLIPRMTTRRDQIADGVHFSWSGLDGLPTLLKSNRRGQLVRASRPDGTLIDTVDDETVARIWTDAGLKLR